MKKNGKEIKNRMIISLVSLVLSLGLFCFFCYAWFNNSQKIKTIALVQIPSRISIVGANRSELEKISLELTNDDSINGTQVTIRRVFCIESTDDYLLEVAHTTNISNMQIKIYPVSTENSNITYSSNNVVSGKDGTKTFFYKPDATYLVGDYLNKDSNGIALQKGDNGSLHDKTYKSSDSVQQNAEPLYWLTMDEEGNPRVEDFDKNDYATKEKNVDGKTEIYFRYYVLELSWDTEKQETDMIYLLASHKE